LEFRFQIRNRLEFRGKTLKACKKFKEERTFIKIIKVIWNLNPDLGPGGQK
jgi:hypothetical protein